MPETGDNRPPIEDQAEILQQRLNDEYEDEIARFHELVEAAQRVPAAIDSSDVNQRAADFVVQLNANKKDLDAARVKEKAPFLAQGRTVDGFFKNMTDRLDKLNAGVKKVMTAYAREVAAEEKRRREEEERVAREAAEEAARLAREAEEAAQTDEGLDEAVAKEEAAEAARADAERAAKAAEAKAADMSRERSAAGSVSSLTTFWNYRDLDRDTIELEKIRHHISTDALEKAVKSFIKAGGRNDDIKGVEIFEDTRIGVR